MPSATVLFSVSPWVRNSGTSEPVAPGIRLRARQYGEKWSSLPAWSAQLAALQPGRIVSLAPLTL